MEKIFIKINTNFYEQDIPQQRKHFFALQIDPVWASGIIPFGLLRTCYFFLECLEMRMIGRYLDTKVNDILKINK